MIGMTHFTYIIATVIIGIFYPAYAILDGKSTRQMLIASPPKKVYVYKFTGVLQLILSGLIFIFIFINDDSIDSIGLSFLRKPIWSLLLVGICWIFLWLLNKIEIASKKRAHLVSQYKDVLYIVPTTIREYKWAVLLSFVAGTLEEIMFRGFLFWQLHQYLPLIPAIIITNIVFAIAHFATKLKNVLIAFMLGIFFSTTYVLTESLWIAICTHVLVDLYSATLAKKLFINNKEAR